jgi:hypothetical protein
LRNRALWSYVAVTATLAAAVILGGCAGSQASRPPDATVPITSIDLIKGKWAGVVDRSPSRSEDFVEVIIGDDASYQVKSARTVGGFQGKGQLTLRDGQAFAETPNGKSTYRLIDRGGKRVLRVDVVETNGLRYGSDLTR